MSVFDFKETLAEELQAAYPEGESDPDFGVNVSWRSLLSDSYTGVRSGDSVENSVAESIDFGQPRFGGLVPSLRVWAASRPEVEHAAREAVAEMHASMINNPTSQDALNILKGVTEGGVGAGLISEATGVAAVIGAPVGVAYVAGGAMLGLGLATAYDAITGRHLVDYAMSHITDVIHDFKVTP